MKAYQFLDAQKLLIKPFDRLNFTLLYIGVSVLSGELIERCLSMHPIDDIGMTDSLEYKLVRGLLLGGLLGFSQWLAIRKYIPDPQWILATVTYSSLAALAGVFWRSQFNWSGSMATGSASLTALLWLTSYSGSILIAFIYGYAQHYVISPYIRKFRWWLWVTLISVGFQVMGIFLVMFAYAYLPTLQINYKILFSAGIAAIQAIAFCCLYRKSSLNESENPTLDPAFNLAAAPDMSDFWKIRRVQQDIERKILKVWATDLNGNHDLTYSIGVSSVGIIVACVPQSQRAIDRITETPLSTLIENSEHSLNQPIAKFNLTFSPPGIAKLESWRGIPRRMLSLALAVGILVVSLLIPRLGIS